MNKKTVILLIFNCSYYISTFGDPCIPAVRFINCKGEAGSGNPMWNLPFDRDHTFNIEINKACRSSTILITWKLYNHETRELIQDLSVFKNKFFVYITARSLPLAIYTLETTVRERTLGTPVGFGKAECWFKIEKSAHPLRRHKLRRVPGYAKDGYGEAKTRCIMNCKDVAGEDGYACLDWPIHIYMPAHDLLRRRGRILDDGTILNVYFTVRHDRDLRQESNRSYGVLNSVQVLKYSRVIPEDLAYQESFLLFYALDPLYAGWEPFRITIRFHLFRPTWDTGISYRKYECKKGNIIFERECRWMAEGFFSTATFMRAKVEHKVHNNTIFLTVGDFPIPRIQYIIWGLALQGPMKLRFYFMFPPGQELHNYNSHFYHLPETWHYKQQLGGNNLMRRLIFADRLYRYGYTAKSGRKIEPIKTYCLQRAKTHYNLIANYIHSMIYGLCCSKGSTMDKTNTPFYFRFLEEVLYDLHYMVQGMEHVSSHGRDEHFVHEDFMIRLSAALVHLETPKHIIPTPDFVEARTTLTMSLARTLNLALRAVQYGLAHGTLIEAGMYTMRYCIHTNFGRNITDAKKELNFTTTLPSLDFHKQIPEDYPDYGESVWDASSLDQRKYSTTQLINSSLLFMNAVIRTKTLGELLKPFDMELYVDIPFFYDYALFLYGPHHVHLGNIAVKISLTTNFNISDIQKGMIIILKHPIFYFLGLPEEVKLDFVQLMVIVAHEGGNVNEDGFYIKETYEIRYTFPKNTSIKFVTYTLPLADDWRYWTDDELNKHMVVLRMEVPVDTTTAIQIKNIKGFPANTAIPEMMQVTLLDSSYPLYPDHFRADASKQLMNISNKQPLYYYNHKETDCFIFLGVIPLRPGPPSNITLMESLQMYSGDSGAGAGGVSFSMSVALYQCNRLINGHLKVLNCSIPEWHSGNLDEIVCQCTDTLYTTVPVINFVEQKKINTTRINFTLGVAFNHYVCLITVIVLAIYCILLALSGRRKQYIINLCFAGDSNKGDRYAYLIGIKTADFADSGTTSNVMIKLHGRKANSQGYVLNYPDPDLRFLQMAGDDYVVIATPEYLGDLRYIEVWTDCSGFWPAWYCDNIRIYDLRRNKKWFFDVQHCFALRDNMECYHKIYATKKQEGKKVLRNTFRYFRWSFGPHHIFNLFDPSVDLEIAYIFRLTVVLSHIVLALALSVLIVAFPRMQVMDALGSDAIIDFTEFVLYTSIIAICASLPNFILAALYRNVCGDGLLKAKTGPIPKKYTKAIWIVLTVFVTIAIIYLLLFGWWISPLTVTSLLIVFVLAIGLDILILENIYLGIYNIYQLSRSRKISESFGYLNFKNIVLEVENQRRFLYRRISIWGIRPFLKHLYTPLSDALLKERRQIDQLRQNLRNVFSNAIKVIALGILLLIWTVIQFEKHEAIMSEHMEDMIIKAKFANSNLSADKVFAIEDFYLYLNRTVVPTTFCTHWYGIYRTGDTALLQDFQTKLINVIRVRKLDVKPIPCPDRDMAKLFGAAGCLPYWTSKNSDRRGEGQGISLSSYQEYDTFRSFPHIESAYDGGGFMTTLGRTQYNSYYMTKRINESVWMTNKTRAFFVEFWTFNANTELFTDVRIVFERGPTKYTTLTYRISSCTFGVRAGALEWIYMGLIVVIIVLIIRLMVLVITQLVSRRLSFFFDIWLIMDAAISILCVILFKIIIQKSYAQNTLLDNVVSERRNKFIVPFKIFDLNEDVRILSGCIVLLCFMRFIQVFHFLDYFRSLHYALIKVFLPAVTCLLCAIVGFIAMSLIAYLRFSAEAVYFNTVSHAFSTQWVVVARLYPEVVNYLKEEAGFGQLYLFGLTVIAIALKISLIVIILVIYKECKRHMSGLRWSYSLVTYYKEWFNYYYEYIIRCIIPVKKKTHLKGGGEEWYEEPVSSKELKHRYENTYKIGIDKMNLMRCILLAVLRNKVVRQGGKRAGIKDFILMEEISRAVYKSRHPNMKEPEGLNDTNMLYSFGIRVPDKRARFISDGRLLEMEAVAKECITTARLEQRKAVMQDRLVMVPDLLSLGRIETILKCLVLIENIFDNISFHVDPKYSTLKASLISVREGEETETSTESLTEDYEEEEED